MHSLANLSEGRGDCPLVVHELLLPLTFHLILCPHDNCRAVLQAALFTVYWSECSISIASNNANGKGQQHL